MEPWGREGSRQAPDAGERMPAGRYRLVSLLGRGGMGAVWRAHDEHLDREVAVKELRLPEHLDEAGRRTWIARLEREARAAARLRHPGIVTVHDRVTGEDGRPWIIMELVRGRSLEDLLKADGPLPPDRVARIGLQVLDALRAAHQAGITHRDIKPANVLLEDDRAVLTDFGIAAVEGDATLTSTGAVLGTPAYMSPEQVSGHEVAAASDLWSLGATLYAAVEGRPPFGGATTGAVFVAIATRDPDPSVHAGPLEPVLRALLRRDPSQRPTAGQLHTRLAALARDRQPAPPTVVQPPDPPPGRTRPRALRWREVKLLLVALGGVLALGLAAVPLAAFTDITQQKGREKRDNARYLANREAVERMTSIPGKVVTVKRANDVDKVYVESELCDDATFAARKCDVDGMVESVLTWGRGQPSVMSIRLNDPKDECQQNPGCEFTVVSRGRPEISEVGIYSQYLSEPDRSIVLGFRVG
ncbi:serine/threonine-protein kinase [Actinomadura sp. WMMA1423]|uniref:serine/threonine-protein kinase n=1 Tax=Actinomadura sp. WMMA1423 TaxID=2591108 RepID=UPI001F109C5F|nr:serine/threonine-protein kinase [Actinomadura sp. WMMA1423]